MNLVRVSTPRQGLRNRLAVWRSALARTFVQPASVTILTLEPEEVARRLSALPGATTRNAGKIQ
jgi:hypothetical protein